MGISGLLAGGSTLSAVGLISGLFATISPMWLITRIELHNKLCWTGHGLWVTGYVWGQDIEEMDLKCEGTAVNTYDTYCKQGNTKFDQSMCGPINYAKSFMIAAQCLGLVAIVLIVLFARNSEKDMKSSAYSSELLLAKLLLFITSSTSLLAALGFFAVYTSQLFTPEHAYELSKHLVAPFPTNQFGCQFQSPLRAKKTELIPALLRSSPLNCIYGGPSFAMAACSFVSWALAAWIFLIMLKDVLRLDRTLKSTGTDGLFIDQVASPTVTSSMPSIRHPLVTSLLYPRHYSMYGAISRKYYGSPWRKPVLFVLPMLTLGTATAFSVMMLMNGMAVDVFIRLSSPYFTHQSNFTSVLDRYPGAAYRFVEDEKKIPTLEIIEEVFDFTMLTSIKNFWDGKAYALAVLTAVFCAAWPFLRVAMQLYVYFVPVKENIRGRVLTWLDSLGKWTMVNTFILCFMGVAFHLTSVLKFKSLFSKDLLHVGVEVSLGPRIATYTFVFTVLASIVISEMFVYTHRQCKDWEEMRNAEEAAAAATPSNDSPRPPMRNSVMYQHGYGYEALCHRHQNLAPGKKYVYTTASNVIMWIFLGLTMCTTLAGMLEVGIAFTFDGVVGQVIVDESQVRREFSLVSVGTSIQTQMGSVPAGGKFLTAVFFLLAFVAPLLRIAGLSILWFVPMRPRRQKSWFHLMEVIESWSALDVFFVSTLAATLEIGEMSKVILGGSFPGVEALVNKTFPKYGGLFILHQELLPGMYLLFAGVVLEKAMSQFIIAQAATAVAERIEEEKLSLKRRLGLPGAQEENDLFRELTMFPETLAVLSPAARYVSASGAPALQYTGIPRVIWQTGIRFGLLREYVEEEERDAEAEYSAME